jgi:hypothetical protein
MFNLKFSIIDIYRRETGDISLSCVFLSRQWLSRLSSQGVTDIKHYQRHFAVFAECLVFTTTSP